MKIKFKNIKEVDFNKVFPIIKEKDYILLSGQELIIQEDEYKKLLDNKYLNLGGFHISLDLIIIQEKDINDKQVEIQALVDERFIFAEDIVDILFAGIECQKNIILWGRGGHGKSEITELVMQEMVKKGIIPTKPFVQAFGDGLTEEKLFGGMDIKLYKEKGLIQYLPEYSFMNHEIVIFEEIFDAPASVLLSLKDIMTSKQFRQGNETFNIKTKLFIGLTNKSKKEFAEKDESLKALAERFSLTLNVEWKSYKKHNFLKLFQTVLGTKVYSDNTEKLTTLANIIDMNNAEGVTFVSPRTAINAAQLYLKGKKLDYISEIDSEILLKYNKIQLEEEFNSLHNELLSNIEKYIEEAELDTIDQSEDFLKSLAEMEEEIGGVMPDTSFMDASHNVNKRQKLIKSKYLLSIVDRLPSTGKKYKDFQNVKQRLNEIIKLIQSEEVAVEQESSE